MGGRKRRAWEPGIMGEFPWDPRLNEGSELDKRTKPSKVHSSPGSSNLYFHCHPQNTGQLSKSFQSEF